MLALSGVVNPRRTSQKIWGGFLYEEYIQSSGIMEWLWIDSNGKMETRNPIEGYFDSELSVICNHWGVYGGLKLQLKIIENFFSFFGKTTPYRKIFYILFR